MTFEVTSKHASSFNKEEDFVLNLLSATMVLFLYDDVSLFLEERHLQKKSAQI